MTEGRRSRVPVGTFGGSEPPGAPARKPATDADAAAPGSADPALRRRFTDTLTGEVAVSLEQPKSDPSASLEAQADPSASEQSEALDSSEAKKRHVSTIVGHPATPPPTVAGAPVLAPPKWRGAQAYMDGEEPQPRISSIPTPAPVAGAQSWSSASKVTTKIGPLPTTLETPAPAATDPAALGDAIQEMLDSQASVPMQVEEPNGNFEHELSPEELAADELPIEELGLDELLDEPDEPEPEPPTVAVASVPPATPRPLARIALRSELSRAGDSQVSRLPSAVVELTATPTERAPATGETVTESGPQHVEATPKPASPKTTLAAEPSSNAEIKVTSPGPGAIVSSLLPAEIPRRDKRDDMRATAGAMLVAAMVLIGVGGWFLTRGGYRAPAHLAVRAPDPPVAAPVIPPPPSAVASPPNALASAPPAATQPTPGTESALDAHAQKAAAKRTRTAAKTQTSDVKEDSASAKTGSEPAVLRVVPRDAPQETPDTPSRENVLSALAPIRPAVAECARGQHGTAQLDITVANTGSVTHAVVGGDFSGTPEGSCIARAARAAQFVAFKKPRFRVIYPFSL